MKILLINKYHRQYAGPERMYFDTAKMLTDAGHEVAFFAMQHPKNVATQWSKYFVPEVDYLEGEKVSLWQKIKIAQNIIFNFQAKKQLEQLIDEFQPDVAHMWNIYHQLSPSIIWALKKKKVPMVLTLCDYKLASPNYSLFVRGQIWHHSSGWRCIADRCVKDSYAKSFVCAVEQWVHRALGTFGQINVYLGLSQFLINTFKDLGFPYPIQLLEQPLIPLPDVSQPLSPVPRNHFLYFGRLSHEKGIATLIRAFSLLKGDEQLSIVGFGPEEEGLKELVRELGVAGKVSFLGPVYGDDLKQILARTTAVVVPSEWYENTPYSLLESLAAGTVVIAARVGSLPEKVRDGENGLLFEPGNAEDLAQTIEKLQTLDLERLRDNARHSVLSMDQETYFRSLMEIYTTLSK